MLLTRPPLGISLASYQNSSFDLHVLSTPPAFVLSQNQTLRRNVESDTKHLMRDSKIEPLALSYQIDFI